MSADYKFREACKNDHTRLLVLEQKIIDYERPFDQNIKDKNVTYYDIENLIADSDSLLLVVELEGELIGSGYAQKRNSKSCHSHEHHCYIGFVYLEPAHRGKGVGRGILERLKEWGVKRGLQHFHLDVYAENESAIRAYDCAGFKKVSVMMELVV